MIRLYNYFTSTIYSSNGSYEFFDLKLSKAHKRAIIDFLVEMVKSGDRINERYLFNYFSYQFEYISKKTPIHKETRIPLRSIVGKVAQKRWFEKTDNYMYFVHDSLAKKGIDFRQVTPEELKLRDSDSLIEVEEIEKRRFLNQERGFAHCINTTSLFNHNSLNCLKCCFREQCKLILKQSYLPIYVDRGYVV